MIARIRELMDYKSLTSSQFADGIEVPRAVISHILSERNKPSLDVVQKILSVHRDISVSWLLLGEGEMLKVLAEKPMLKGEPTPNTATTEHQPPQHQPKVGEAVPASKVQNIEKPVPPSVPPISSGKTIERVMIFYTDHTFTAYSPD